MPSIAECLRIITHVRSAPYCDLWFPPVGCSSSIGRLSAFAVLSRRACRRGCCQNYQNKRAFHGRPSTPDPRQSGSPLARPETERHHGRRAFGRPCSLRIYANEGYALQRLGVRGSGQIDLAEYASLLDDDTALISVMWANNETGVLDLTWQFCQRFEIESQRVKEWVRDRMGCPFYTR